MPRPLLIALAILLVLVIGAAVLIPLLLDKDKILTLAAGALYEQTGATLTIAGDSSLSIFPTLGVALSEAAITLPEKTEPDLQIRSIEIGVQLMPLLTGQVEIDTFKLQGLIARIETGADKDAVDTSTLSDKQLDAFYAQRRKASLEASTAAGTETALSAPLALRVRRLSVTDARVELISPDGAAPTLIELTNLQAKDLNLDGEAIPLDLELRLPGDQTIDISLQGAVAIDQQSQTTTINELLVTISGATAQPLILRPLGVIDMVQQIADLQLELELGDTLGSGTLRYAQFESPQIDSTLQLNQLDPALLVLAGPDAASAAAGEEASSSGSGDDPLPLNAIRAIDTRVALSVKQVLFGAHQIDQLQANLRAVDGVIKLQKITGMVHGGQLQARATFNGKHNTATLDTSGSLSKLDIAAALAATGTPATVTGSATLDWQLTSRGRTANELTAALNGPVKLGTEAITIEGTSIEKLICQTVALTNKEQLSAEFPANTRLETLSADIQLAGGKATLQPLRAELPEIALVGNGSFDLLKEDFSATFKAKLSPGLEQLDHACRVSKRLTAIDWPVNCRGNINTEPGKWCKVDAEKIITDLAINEGQRKLEKEAGKLLNKFFK